MNHRLRSIVSALLVLAIPSLATAETGPSTPEERAVASHVDFLADDLLAGRDTGSVEYEIAARYVASQLMRMGLEPAGTEGFLQPVPLVRHQLVPDSSSFVIDRGGESIELTYGDDYLVGGSPWEEATKVTAPVVFAGYGITAPELGHDDYAGIETEGRIVVVFRGAPPSFPHNQRAYYSSSRTKRELAASHGAVALLSVRSISEEERSPWARSLRFAGRPGFKWVDADGRPGDRPPAIRVGGGLSHDGANKLFQGSGMTFETVLSEEAEGRVQSRKLRGEATIRLRTALEPSRSLNVAALLPGADPELADEVVVYTAHLDHVGRGPEEDGDEIYNGTYDNAMGVGILLEVARTFVDSSERPRRSILFLAVGAEEKGLLGSGYFVENPTVPIHSIVANVNLDMPLFLYPIREVVAFGAEHSSLEHPTADAALEVGWELAPDPMPHEVLFVRSDQYNFVRAGVPSIFLVTGFGSADPSVDGEKIWKEFLSTHYHHPSDETDLPIHWASAVKFVEVNHRIGVAVANETERPTWNEGDFFGERFGAAAPSASVIEH